MIRRILFVLLAALAVVPAVEARRRWIPAQVGPGSTPYITNQTLGSPRADATLLVGATFVAAADATITELGRWVISGNSQTHTLYIYSGPDVDAGTLLGSVTVNTSGAPVGAYLYGTLSSSVSITNGTRYWVFSAENNGGDQWYDFDTSVTHAAIGGSTEGAYNDGVNHISTNGSNKIYVPINFKYQ